MTIRKIIVLTLIFGLTLHAVFLNPSFSEEKPRSDISVNSLSSKFPNDWVTTGTSLMYGISDDAGFMVSEDGGARWETRNVGLPVKWIYPYNDAEPRTLTALAVDPCRPERVAVTTARQLFISEDSGRTWREIVFSKPFPAAAFVTAVALSPQEPKAIAVGTAYQGLYETRDFGKTWVNLTPHLQFLYQGAGFYEEISALAYHPQDGKRLIFGCGFGKGLYQLHRESGAVKLSGFDPESTSHITGVYFSRIAGDGKKPEFWQLSLRTRSHTAHYQWDPIQKIGETKHIEPILDDEAVQRRLQASNRFGLYLRPDYASGRRLDEKLSFMKENGLNTIVVDFKDDSGYITYNTSLSFPKQIGAVRSQINIREFLKKAKEHRIYVIGRLVVFKDERLYRYQNCKYAIWDHKTVKPWGHFVKTTDVSGNTVWVQREFWVDPYHADVWDYNISLAQELESLGVDEIQFDYIRFPTDGDLSTATYRYRRKGMEKVDALESFLRKARAALRVPISTDLYGFNCWFNMDSWNGQNMAIFSKYVDVICPMYYPSHFPSAFMKESGYLERARQTYRQGTYRAEQIGRSRSLIRPYVQAFLLGGERKMDKATYSDYLKRQIQGAVEGNASGFLLWNFSNQYYMVTKSLAEFLQELQGQQDVRSEE